MSAAPARKSYAPRMPLDQRREQLLDATIRIIARDGYDKVSVDAIARECGVTRPVVYSAYDGLGPLLHELLDRSQRRALTSLAAILEDADLADADAFVLSATRRLIDMVRTDADIWGPILGLTEGAPREVRERIETDRETIRRQLAGLIETGLAIRGGPDLDAEVTAHMLIATLEHFGRLILEDPPRFATERLVAAVEKLLAALR